MVLNNVATPAVAQPSLLVWLPFHDSCIIANGIKTLHFADHDGFGQTIKNLRGGCLSIGSQYACFFGFKQSAAVKKSVADFRRTVVTGGKFIAPTIASTQTAAVIGAAAFPILEHDLFIAPDELPTRRLGQ